MFPLELSQLKATTIVQVEPGRLLLAEDHERKLQLFGRVTAPRAALGAVVVALSGDHAFHLARNVDTAACLELPWKDDQLRIVLRTGKVRADEHMQLGRLSLPAAISSFVAVTWSNPDSKQLELCHLCVQTWQLEDLKIFPLAVDSWGMEAVNGDRLITLF